MPLTFNAILRGVGVAPADVRVLRHQDNRAARGRSPYSLWRNDPASFELYQSTQSVERRAILSAPLWAVFVGTPQGETLFVGLWHSRYIGLNAEPRAWPHAPGEDAAGTVDIYELTTDERTADLAGRLLVNWTGGARNWAQYADRREKPVVEIRRSFEDPEYPGHLNFQENLSAIATLPITWRAALESARGVYILTCPRTNEQYVGSATGAEGFLGRWSHYIANAHGGNVGLRSREPSDYEVAILEVVGNAATSDDIVASEALWKRKLRTREMGLNRN